MAKGVEEVALIFVAVEAAQQLAFTVDIGAAHIVPGGDVVGAEVFGSKLEEGFKFDLFIAQNIRVRRAAGFVLFREELKDVIPIFGGKVNGVQFNAQLIADRLRIGKVGGGGAYSSPSSSSQFFMNRPSTLYPCCSSRYAETEESTPPDMPTITFSGFLTWKYSLH